MMKGRPVEALEGAEKRRFFLGPCELVKERPGRGTTARISPSPAWGDAGKIMPGRVEMGAGSGRVVKLARAVAPLCQYKARRGTWGCGG